MMTTTTIKIMKHTTDDRRLLVLVEQQIRSLAHELKASKLALRQEKAEEQVLREENSKLQARIHLADARRNLRNLEQTENVRNKEMRDKMQGALTKMSKRIEIYKMMTQKTKENNNRMLQQIREMPAAGSMAAGEQKSKTMAKIQMLKKVLLRPKRGGVAPFFQRFPKRSRRKMVSWMSVEATGPTTQLRQIL